MKVHLFLAIFLILSIVEKLFSQQCLVTDRIRSLGALPERTGYSKPALHQKVSDYSSKNLFSVCNFLADQEIILLPSLITLIFYCKWPHNLCIHVMLFCTWKVSSVVCVTDSVL